MWENIYDAGNKATEFVSIWALNHLDKNLELTALAGYQNAYAVPFGQGGSQDWVG
jgi:hypothetical protein